MERWGLLAFWVLSVRQNLSVPDLSYTPTCPYLLLSYVQQLNRGITIQGANKITMRCYIVPQCSLPVRCHPTICFYHLYSSQLICSLHRRRAPPAILFSAFLQDTALRWVKSVQPGTTEDLSSRWAGKSLFSVCRFCTESALKKKRQRNVVSPAKLFKIATLESK